MQSSVQVVIEWKPPHEENRNGVIDHYMVNISETETEQHYQEVSISPSLTLSDLHPFYTYQISVAAVTIGVGPYSALTTFRMLEAGRIFLKEKNLIIIIVCCCLQPQVVHL